MKRNPKNMGDIELQNALAYWQAAEGQIVLSQDRIDRYVSIENECVRRGFLAVVSQ